MRCSEKRYNFAVQKANSHNVFPLWLELWMDIINLFHNDEINTNHAQLIFTSHNPIFLNSNLLRRDEIKFVERDSDDHSSSLYSLSDFGTGIGEDEDYLSRYLANVYGAIPDIDFSSLFETTTPQECDSKSNLPF